MTGARGPLAAGGILAAGGLLALAIAGAGCSGAETRIAATSGSTSATNAARAPLPYETPARWQVHPTLSSAVTAAMRLADGRCLVTEENGQRWLTAARRVIHGPDVSSDEHGEDGDEEVGVDPAPFVAEPVTSCGGAGQPAVDRAPEPLVAIVRLASSYGFVGASGTLHEAASPLGRFTRRIAPPEPFVRVRGSGRTLLAVTATGRVLRWDEEAGYQRVDIGDLHAVDVAVSPGGHAVVLATPEAVLTSDDGGRRFTRAAAPLVGAERVGYGPGGPFVIEGVTASLTWDPREPATFTKGAATIHDRALDVSIDQGRSPMAELVTIRRAALDGDRYWETGAEEAYGEWMLRKGKMDGTLSVVPIPVSIGSPEEGNLIVAARGRHLALISTSWREDGPSAEAWISHDAGATFDAAIPLETSEDTLVGMAVSPDGVVLCTGVCLDGDTTVHGSCDVGALIVRPGLRPASPRGASPNGTPLAPAFSIDGHSAYFLGARDEDGHLALFVSKDAGHTFEERALELEDALDVTFDAPMEAALSVSESGTVGVLLEASGDLSGSVWLTTNGDGREVHAREVPDGAELVAGFGERVLALARRHGSRDSTDPFVWESLDAGLTWIELPAPVVLQEGYLRRGDLACSAVGCLIGDSVTRMGWGGGGEPKLPFEEIEPEQASNELLTPIVCEPRAGSTWTRIENVAATHTGTLVTENEAARGRAAWMLPTHDRQTGAVGVAIATMPESGGSDPRIVTKQLLGPVPKGSLWALSMRPQIEGIAVARTEIDAAAPKVGAAAWAHRRMKKLEIAWENLEEGSSARAVVPDPGTLLSSSVVGSPEQGYTLQPSMLSVSPKGIFVRATAAESTAFFVDTAGKVKPFRFPSAPMHLPNGRPLSPDDAVNVDGTFVATTQIGSDRNGSLEQIVLFRPPAAGSAPDEPWTPWAMTLAPADGDRSTSRADWTYDGGHLAVWTLHVVPDSGHATAWLQRVQADGTLTTPSRLPTPYDLAKTPRPCTAAEHTDLPRLKMLGDVLGQTAFPGTRHPVLVLETETADAAPEPSTNSRVPAKTAAPKPPLIGRASMISTGYVMRGTPASPCIDAIAARGTEDWRTTALILGDLQNGWYFRPAKSAPPKRPPAARGAPKDKDDAGDAAPAPGNDAEVRPLVCRFDPKATIPTSVLARNARR